MSDSGPYSDVDWGLVDKVLAACQGFEGVAPGFLNELECSAILGPNIMTVGSGGAVADGKVYYNSTALNLAIPSAAHDTRIDRVVLRVDWSTSVVRAHVITGTAALLPTPPAITSTPGVTYDLKLCQVLVDTIGNVSVTDERVWASRLEFGQQAGDMMYWPTSDSLARVPAGTDFQTLRSMSGVPTWKNFIGCSLINSNIQNIADNLLSPIVMWNEQYDSDNFHVGALDGFMTIPVGFTGYYMVGAEGFWDADPTASKMRELFISINSASAYYVQSATTSDANLTFHQNVNALIYLVAGDKVEIAVKHKTGAPVNFSGVLFWLVRVL